MTLLSPTLHDPAAMWFIVGTTFLSVAAAVLLRRRERRAVAGALLCGGPLVILSVTSGTLASLIASLTFFAFAALVGLAVVRLVDAAELTTLERYVFATTAGLGLTCAALFILGLIGAIRGDVVLIVAAVGAAFSAFILYRRPAAMRHVAPPTHGAPFLLVVAGILLMQVAVPYVTSPEVMYDALYYHLTIVRIFIEQGAMIHIPELFASDFPLLPHLIYVAPSLFGSIDAAKFVHFGIGILAALAIYATAARLGGPIAAIVAAVAWLSVPLVLWEMGTAYVDLFSVLFTTCAVLATVLWVETRRVSYAAMAGVAIGLGFGVKVSTAFVAAPLILAVLLLRVRSRSDVGHLAIGAAIAGLLAAPWYVRSFLLTSNPVFPFLNGIFRSPLWEPVNEDFGLDTLFGMGRSPLDLLVVPWRLVVATERFGEVQAGALSALPLLAVLGSVTAILLRGRHASWIGLFLVGSTLGWFASAQYGRYALPILALGAVAFGQAVQLLSQRAPRIVPMASAGLLCLAVAGAPLLVREVWQVPNRVPWDVDFGRVSRETYIDSTSRHYPLYQWMRTNLADHREARVLGVGLGEWPIVHSGSRVAIAHMTLDGRRLLFARSPDETARLLKELGFRYVIVDYFPRPTRFLSSYAVTNPEFMNESLRLLYANRYVYLYAVAEPVPSAESNEQLQDPRLTLASQGGSAPWVPVGGWRAGGSTACAGVVVTEGAGVIQTFAAAPNTLYTLDTVMRASTDEAASGKLQVNWIDADGMQRGSTEITSIGKVAEKHSMSTTSPPGSTKGVVYLTGYGPAAACIEWASLRRGP